MLRADPTGQQPDWGDQLRPVQGAHQPLPALPTKQQNRETNRLLYIHSSIHLFQYSQYMVYNMCCEH